MKKSISTFIIKLLSITMLISVFFNNTIFFAEDTLYTDGDFQYYIVYSDAEHAAIRIAKYIGDDTSVEVPYNFNEYEVKSIMPGAFSGTPATSITLHTNTILDEEIKNELENQGIHYNYVDLNGNTVDEPNSNTPGDVGVQDTNNGDSENNNDDAFEDEIIDISEELEKETVPTSEEEKKRREPRDYINRLNIFVSKIFNSSDYISDFKANPVGYILIGVSVVALIVVLIVAIKKK